MNTDVTALSAAEQKNPNPTVNWPGIALYIVLTFGISWSIWLGLGAIGVPFAIRTAIGMFGPALSALLVRLVRREGFADAGLRLVGRGHRGGWRMYLAAYIAMPLLIAAAIGFALLVGTQHWAFSENFHLLAESITKTLAAQGQSLPSNLSAPIGIIGLIPAIAFAIWLAATGRLKAQPDTLPEKVATTQTAVVPHVDTTSNS